MSDIALIWDVQAGAADFAIEANDLATDDGLETAVMLSLFTDRRAEDGDVLPDGETDRRGWWADTEDDKTGSRLWLLDRSKETQATIDRAVEYTREALQWMIDDKVTDRIEVSAEWIRPEVLGLAVSIFRPKADAVTFQFNYTWDAQDGAE